MTVKEQKRPWYGQHGVNGPRAYGKIIRKGQAVRERAERKPRRSHYQAERKKRDDNSLFPFLSCAAQETGDYGQQRDSRVGYPTSDGGILVLT